MIEHDDSRRLMTAAQVLARIGICRMTLWRFLAGRSEAGRDFPKPIYIGERRFWESGAIESWITSRPRSYPNERLEQNRQFGRRGLKLAHETLAERRAGR